MTNQHSAFARKYKYPEAQKQDVVEDYHGTKVADPYRWLEDPDSPETQAWVAAENELRRSYVDTYAAREAIENRLKKLSPSEMNTSTHSWMASVILFERKMDELRRTYAENLRELEQRRECAVIANGAPDDAEDVEGENAGREEAGVL